MATPKYHTGGKIKPGDPIPDIFGKGKAFLSSRRFGKTAALASFFHEHGDKTAEERRRLYEGDWKVGNPCSEITLTLKAKSCHKITGKKLDWIVYDEVHDIRASDIASFTTSVVMEDDPDAFDMKDYQRAMVEAMEKQMTYSVFGGLSDPAVDPAHEEEMPAGWGAW